MDSQTYKNWITGIFDRSADTYGTNHSDFFDYFAKSLVAYGNITPSSHVLDIATGRGAVLKYIVEAIGPQGSATAIDISPKMIAETSKEFNKFSNIQFLCADAEQLDFRDNSFDYVFCGFGIFFFPNVSAALQEFFRVLKPGGKLVVSTWGKDDYCDFILHKVYNTFGPSKKTLIQDFENPDSLNGKLKERGFIEIKTTSDELKYLYPSFEDWFSSLWSHAARAKLEALSAEQMQQFKTRLKQEMQSHLKPDGLHESLYAHYTSAKKPI